MIFWESVIEIKRIRQIWLIKMEETKNLGYLYCFTSKSLDPVYKIGQTTNLKKRLSGLNSTHLDGYFCFTLPPCKDETKCYSEENKPENGFEFYIQKEKILFDMLKSFRIESNKELFNCNLETIKSAFKEISSLSQEEVYSYFDSNKEGLIECSSCFKFFTEKGIKYHIPTCVPPSDLICKYCKIILKTKRNFEKHLQVCKKQIEIKNLENNVSKKTIDDLTSCILELKNDVNYLKEQFTSFLRKINEQNIGVNKGNVLFSKMKVLSELHISNSVNEVYSSPKIPENISDLAKQIVNKIGKGFIFVSDRSRGILIWKNENEEQVRDIKGLILSQKILNISSSIFEKVKFEMSILSSSENERIQNQINKVITCIDACLLKTDETVSLFGKGLISSCQDKNSFSNN